MIRRAGCIILGIGVLTGCTQSDPEPDGGPPPDMRVGDQGVPPDMRVGDQGVPPDMLIPPEDAGPRPPCPEPWSGQPDALSPRADCQDFDVFDSATCTPASAGLVCEQRAICDPAFSDPGAVVACCEAGVWIRLAEEPDLCGTPMDDMAVPDPVDLGVDAGPAFDCNAVDDPRSAVAEDGRCDAVDIFDNTTCTPNTRIVCSQTVTCDPPFEDPGEVISCCDGAAWVRLEEEPDPCGTPAPENP